MLQKLPDFAHSKALVIGDVMLDRYWYGDAHRISPEAPVPVVNVSRVEARPGGAGNVALNLRALGMQVSLYGCMGNDEASLILQSALDEAGIQHDLQIERDHPTVSKLRVLSQNQQLLRLDFEENFLGLQDIEQLPHFLERLDQADVVILSDYNKGTLASPQLFIQAAIAMKKPIIVDPKGDDFGKYFGATVLTPNQKEFETIVGRCATDDQLVERGLRLRQEQQFSALLITRGSKGMSLLQPEEIHHYPAIAREVYDVTGAGDTVIAVLAAMIATGQSLPHATIAANLAASIVVSRLGAATVTPSELQNVLEGQFRSRDREVSRDSRITADH